ncbi:MAG: hypothetical protein JSU70_21875 [Phycisphaerales bacterium]|nr:MAG: hypothetical protein JSU70_21875 [Phycisphaerales bacterium]
MKRVHLVFVLLVVFSSSCAERQHQIDSLTRATPPAGPGYYADASGWDEAPLNEDGSAWSEAPPVPREHDTLAPLGMPDPKPKPYIEAYTDKKSYLPGETVHFHVSTNAETYSIEIRKEQWKQTVIAKVTDLPGAFYETPPYEDRPWATGANWPVSYSWVVPAEWENGNYLALLRTSSGEYAYAYHPFIVRTRVRGSRSKVAFVMNYNTRQAYNRWGGKSLYFTRVPDDKHKGVEVTFLRPFEASGGRGNNYWGQWEVSSQLIADGFDPEFITEREIYSDPTILRAYHVLVFAGHHEYISRRTYDALEAHHHRGGHLAFFSGNDIWWQVRFEDNVNRMVGYRSYALREDPMMGVDDAHVTTLWKEKPLNRPAEALQGVSYVLYSYCFEREDFIVQDANHFIFEGTGLRSGDAFGYKTASGETDEIGPSSPPIMDSVLVGRRDRVREGYESYVQVDHVGATAVYYEDTPEYGFPDGRGGQVFSAGTHHGWGDGLGGWSPGYQKVRRATRNIIQHMLDSPPPPACLQDLAVLASHWLGECESPDRCEYADIDMNGTVDVRDLAYFATDWSSN